MKRYALATKIDGTTMFWTGRAWAADMDSARLANGSEAAVEMARMNKSLAPFSTCKVVDVVVRGQVLAIRGPAFRSAIAGLERTKENMAKAEKYANDAVAAAGYCWPLSI